MDGNSPRKRHEERQARLLEASGFAGPLGAGMVAWEEKSHKVAIAAEQRRLLRDASLEPPADPTPVLQRISAWFHQFAGRGATPKSTMSTPNHA